MTLFWLNLQNCQPGWGYDCRTGLFIPINDVGNLETITYDRGFSFYYKQNPYSPDWFSNIIAHWVINDNPNGYRFMHFYFSNYKNCEFALKIRCHTKSVNADKLDNYPQEATHFVERVNYGMEMLIFVDKKNSRMFDENGRDEFLEKVWKGEEKLTKEQENAECPVLIFAKNPEETTVKQMKLSEIFQILENFENGKYPYYEITLGCSLELTKRIRLPDDQTRRKIQMFFSKLWNPQNIPFVGKSNKILIEKEQQTNVTFGDANDLDSQTIIMDKNSLYSMKPKILQCLKMKILLLNEVNELQIWNTSNSKRSSFGFAVNREQFTQESTDVSKIFVSPCPKKCTNDDRQWICINCGNFFRVNGFDVVCDCGTTHVSNLNYECCDPKHPKTVSLWKKGEHIAPISVPETNSVEDELLESIKQQLKKHDEVHNESQLSESGSKNKFPSLFSNKTSIYYLKIETIQQLKMPIILSNDVEKPYVWNKDFSEKNLLGFVSFSNQPTAKVTETNETFVMRCPKRCSNNLRQWICMNCGLFFKTKNHDVVCDCGVFNITDLIFECFEPTHLKTFTMWQTPPLPANFTDEQKLMLDVIKQQLEKIVKKEELTADDKLSSVIQSIDNDDGSILDQLETLDLNSLDGDTVDLINKFLSSSK